MGITGSVLGLIGNLFIVTPTASIFFWISIMAYIFAFTGAIITLFKPEVGGMLLIFAAAVGVFVMPSTDLIIGPLLIFIAGVIVVKKGKGFRYR